MQIRVSRERLAHAASAELQTSIATACELIEKALPVLAKVPVDPRRHMETAVALRDTADILAGLGPAGGPLRRTSAQRCRALSEEIAAGLVRSAGDLRTTVAFLLAHKPDPEN